MERGLCVIGLCLVAAAPLRGQAGETLTIVAEHVSAEGERTDSEALRPGEAVRYVLTFTNGEAKPVRNMVLANPIPEGLEYVAGSASADAAGVVIEFSMDGGETFEARPMVERVVDGRRRRVPAPAAEYTHVRWRLGEWVQPGAQVRAEFRALLPESGGE